MVAELTAWIRVLQFKHPRTPLGDTSSGTIFDGQGWWRSHTCGECAEIWSECADDCEQIGDMQTRAAAALKPASEWRRDMPNTADVPVETLIAWDVKVVFGLPGDGINGMMEALRTRQTGLASFKFATKNLPRLSRLPTRNGRAARSLPGDVGARRHAPADRPL
jgi:hypothetical protein